MININVFSEEKAWSKKIKKKELFFKKICNAFPKKYKFLNKKVSLTLLLSNNTSIKRLNKNFRNKNKSTDILSFPAYNKKNLKRIIKNHNNIYLGDVIININKIKKSYSKKEFKYRFDELWIHGFIHLFGFQHKKHNEFIKMNKIEKIFLKLINK